MGVCPKLGKERCEYVKVVGRKTPQAQADSPGELEVLLDSIESGE